MSTGDFAFRQRTGQKASGRETLRTGLQVLNNPVLLGVLLVVAGCITAFIQRDVILLCALVFPGVALFLLVAKPAQLKKKALMQQQLGGFFRTELTKAFGPEPEPATLPID